MDSTLIAGILGTAGTVLAAVIAAYRDEIKNFLFGPSGYSYLKGTWDATWVITSSTESSLPPITDRVTITGVNGRLIKGSGITSGFGNWALEGKAAEFAITLSYAGEQEKTDMVGVVILKKETPMKLTGVWCQYTPEGSLRSGTTSWSKVQ